MKIGLIDVDGHNYPNLALMKLSAWHKAHGDNVEWWWGFEHYDRVYMSKVFDETYSPDIPEPVNADEIIKGGTGYVRREKDGTLWIFTEEKWTKVHDAANMDTESAHYQEYLPEEIEHIYPDYSLYPNMTKDTAFGFLTRGCPRGCHFCAVAGKEGRRSRKAADLPEWWSGQKNIVLMDPNILACPDHPALLRQLVESGAWVDVNQGLDCRLLTKEIIEIINRMKLKNLHFAWDYMKESKDVLRGLKLYAELAERKPHGNFATVYCLTNYDTTMEENLYRIYKLRDMGYDPYVMIYDKPNAPREVKRLQRWCNNRAIFKTCKRFEDYCKKQGGDSSSKPTMTF